MSTARNGFTLIELLIVISIMVIATGAAIPSFASYVRNQSIRQGQEKLKADLRTVQSKALTGALSDKLIGGVPVKYWAIRIKPSTNTFNTFIAAVDTTCPEPIPAAQQQGYEQFSPDLEIKNTGSYQCIFFSMANGNITTVNFSSNQLIVRKIGSTTDADCRKVLFTTSGLIYSSNISSCN